MAQPEKITIVEGPPPTFELVLDPWLLGLTEGSRPARVVLCRLRAANGPALVERCYRAWREAQAIHLEYRGEDGATQQAPIIAVRWGEAPEGHLLLLWVRLEVGEEGLELDIESDDFSEGSEEDPDLDRPM